MKTQLVFVQGGGVGFDQEESIRRILEANQIPLEFDVHLAGRAAQEKGTDVLPAAMFDAIRQAGTAIKTKLLPLQESNAHAGTSGQRMASNINVEFRRRLGLFASVRPVHNVLGLPSRFTGVNFLLVREITEDLYAASEHEIVPGVVQSFKIVTEAACLKFFRFAFELTRTYGKKSIHCIHKANILKLADGLFLDCFRKVAAEYPDILAKDLIVDNACMQLVSRPQQFEVMAAGNLYGDLLSDLGAGLVGGISSTSAINHGEGVRVYEAVYGTGYEAVPPDRANPLPLLMPVLELLKDRGEHAAAARILKAVESVLQAATCLPSDLGGNASTKEFTAAIIARLN